jgi:hypothetical protein
MDYRTAFSQTHAGHHISARLQEALAGVNPSVPKFVALNVLAAERFA